MWPPLTVVGLVALGLTVYAVSSSVRAALRTVRLQSVVGLHALRLPIGAFFLFDLTRGNIPEAFAKTAGYGDIAVGAAALAVAAFFPRPRAIAVWNAVGLADILVVVATANRLTLLEHDPLMRAAFGQPFYALLPLFIVPVVILTHLLVFQRLYAERAARMASRGGSMPSQSAKAIAP